jgi:hypothetical protein
MSSGPAAVAIDNGLLDLPDELLLMILSYLSIADLLSITLVCVRLKGVARDKAFFRRIVEPVRKQMQDMVAAFPLPYQKGPNGRLCELRVCVHGRFRSPDGECCEHVGRTGMPMGTLILFQKTMEFYRNECVPAKVYSKDTTTVDIAGFVDGAPSCTSKAVAILAAMALGFRTRPATSRDDECFQIMGKLRRTDLIRETILRALKLPKMVKSDPKYKENAAAIEKILKDATEAIVRLMDVAE